MGRVRYLVGLLGLVALALSVMWALDVEHGEGAAPTGRGGAGVDSRRSTSTALDPAALDGVLQGGGDAAARRPDRQDAGRAGGAGGATPPAVVERHPGRIVLDVVDAATRMPLTGVWVEEWRKPLPGRQRKLGPPSRLGPRLNEATESPVELRWPTGSDRRIEKARVFVDGYASEVVDVHVLRGGRHEVRMERACTLEVTLGGASPGRARLSLLDALSGEPLYSNTTAISVATTIEGLAPGRVLVAAEAIGREAFAAVDTVLSAGVPNEVLLFLSEGEQEAPLRFVIDVPSGTVPEEVLYIEYRVDALESDNSGTFKIELDPSEAVSFGSRERYTFTQDAIESGVGEAWVDDLLVHARFVHTAKQPATVLLRVPDPFDFEFVCVDAATGERTPHTRADIGFLVHDTVRGVEDLAAVSPGRFLATAVAADAYVGVPSAHGYLEANVRVDARPGVVVEVPLEPIPSVLVGLVAGRPKSGSVPWPRDVEPVLSRGDAPDAEWRYEFEGEGVRLWVDRQSGWELRLPDVPGFKPGQTAYVWFGEDTPLGVKPVGLEPE